MAVLAKGSDSRMPIFFNVGARVGEGGSNIADDVALVTYLMKLAGKSAQNPKAKAACQAVQVGTTCTPAVIQCIKDLQAAIGVSVDGRVSPSNPSLSYGSGMFLIAHFNIMVRRANPNIWPRIDMIPDAPTPQSVVTLVQRSLIGSS